MLRWMLENWTVVALVVIILVSLGILVWSVRKVTGFGDAGKKGGGQA